MEIKEIFTFYGPSKSPTTTTTYIHTTKDSLAPLFYLQQCSSRWANPPCYRVIELLMDFVSSYQKEIRQIFPIKQKYYQTAGFWVLLHSHLSSFCQKDWDGRELLKVSKSQKQIMRSWILPKNERWGNFQYIKLPQRSFFGRIQDNIFFFEIFWPLELVLS